jgi:hypothetical protein
MIKKQNRGSINIRLGGSIATVFLSVKGRYAQILTRSLFLQERQKNALRLPVCPLTDKKTSASCPYAEWCFLSSTMVLMIKFEGDSDEQYAGNRIESSNQINR